MKITELLNAQPTGRANGDDAALPLPPMAASSSSFGRKLDMASLDRFAAQRQKTMMVAPHDHVTSIPLLQRPFPFADLVAPPRDAAMTAHTAPTISPIASSTEDEAAEQKPRKRRPTSGKLKLKQESTQSAEAAASALTALAQAAVEAVKQEDEQPTTHATKRRARAPAKAKATAAAAGIGTGTDAGAPGSADGAVASAGRPAPMTNEEKRAKQRMLVKKSYYRKIDTLNTLRETVTQLEQEYSAVVEASQQHQSKTTALPRHSISALVSSSAEGELMQSFQDMAVHIDHLRHENEGLRAIAMEQSKAQTRVGILVHEEFRDQQKRAGQYGDVLQQIPAHLRTPEEAAEAEHARSSPHMTGNDPARSPERPKGDPTRSASPVIHMTPMTEDECIEVARDAYSELVQFRKNKDFITSGGHVFGWRDRRRIEGDQVQFALEKTFHHRTAEQLATNTWRVLSTESGMNRIYSSSLRATYHLVQRVSDHNVVFYRTMDRVGQNVLLKSLILASFVQTETGYMVLFRSIDPHKRNVRNVATAPAPAATHLPSLSLDAVSAPANRKEIWVDMFSWGVFESAGANNEHCTDFFGGFVPATIAANGAFWMMEVLLIAVRCESECVGPLFILQQADDEEKLQPETEPMAASRRAKCSDGDQQNDGDVVMEMP